jgi:hypothetical protein
VANLRDRAKVTKAMNIEGARYIRIRALPARLGLGARIRSGRAARRRVGLFPLFEAEHGEIRGARASAVPVTEYLRLRKRFAICSAIARARPLALSAVADRNVPRFGLLD